MFSDFLPFFSRLVRRRKTWWASHTYFYIPTNRFIPICSPRAETKSKLDVFSCPPLFVSFLFILEALCFLIVGITTMIFIRSSPSVKESPLLSARPPLCIRNLLVCEFTRIILLVLKFPDTRDLSHFKSKQLRENFIIESVLSQVTRALRIFLRLPKQLRLFVTYFHTFQLLFKFFVVRAKKK